MNSQIILKIQVVKIKFNKEVGSMKRCKDEIRLKMKTSRKTKNSECHQQIGLSEREKIRPHRQDRRNR